MTASDALKMTREALGCQAGPIADAVKIALDRIKAEAMKGKQSVVDPVAGLDPMDRRAAYRYLAALGFRTHRVDRATGWESWTVSW